MVSLLTSGEGRGLKIESVPSGQQFNQSCLCNEASIKIKINPQGWELGKFFTVEHMEIQESGAGGGHGISVPLPHILPWVSLPSGCSELYPFIITGNLVSKWDKLQISSVSHSRKLIEPKDEGGRNLCSIASWSEGQVTTWACNWPLKERALLQF